MDLGSFLGGILNAGPMAQMMAPDQSAGVFSQVNSQQSNPPADTPAATLSSVAGYTGYDQTGKAKTIRPRTSVIANLFA